MLKKAALFLIPTLSIAPAMASPSGSGTCRRDALARQWTCRGRRRTLHISGCRNSPAQRQAAQQSRPPRLAPPLGIPFLTSMCLVAGKSIVRRVFELNGIDQVLKIYDSVAAAQEACAA